MDYQKTIDTFFKKESKYIIEKLKEYKNQFRSFEFAIDQIRRTISERSSSNILSINNSVFNNIIYDFKHYEELYKTGISISLVIDNEIKSGFEKIRSSKLFDKDHKEIISYSFDALIKDLIEYDTLEKIENRLAVNSELYRIFYESNQYDKFTLQSFEGHVVNSNLYRNLFSKFKPGEPIPIAVKKIDEYQNVGYDIVVEKDEFNNLNKTVEAKPIIKKQKFELNEQLLILNLCLVDSKSIPTTEKSKLIILIGEIKDETIFKESPNTNTVYQKIIKGVDRNGSKKNMIQIIDNILIKIECFDLNMTNQTLKKHRAKLISEQNQAKKTQ